MPNHIGNELKLPITNQAAVPITLRHAWIVPVVINIIEQNEGGAGILESIMARRIGRPGLRIEIGGCQDSDAKGFQSRSRP
jgi:hypothetical protein